MLLYMQWTWLLLYMMMFVNTKDIKIGFVCSSDEQEIMIRMSIAMVNANASVLPNYRVVALGNVTTDRYSTMRSVCWQLKNGISAMIGPGENMRVRTVSSLIVPSHLPLITPFDTDSRLEDQDLQPYVFRTIPSDFEQSTVFLKLISYLGYTTISLLTDDSELGMNFIAAFEGKMSNVNIRIVTLQKFSAVFDTTMAPLDEQLTNIKTSGCKIVLLHCEATVALKVLSRARSIGILDAGWMWLITNQIASSEILANEQYLNGLVGIRLPMYPGNVYNNLVKQWRNTTGYNSSYVPTTGAVAYADAIMALTTAMRDLYIRQGQAVAEAVLDCQSDKIKIPDAGLSNLTQALEKVKIIGALQNISFDKTHGPLSPKYDIVLKDGKNWTQLGSWSSDTGEVNVAIMNKRGLGDFPLVQIRDQSGVLQNRTLRIVTIRDPPFVQYSDANVSDCKGNDCYTGYCIDLIKVLATDLGFTYNLYLVPDGNYGSKDESTGKWNGLIAELLYNASRRTNADLALAPITISAGRKEVIDFTKPYKDFMLGIALGSPDAEYNPWSFLVPLTPELWLYTILAAFLVGIWVAIVDKLSPYGHHGKKAQADAGSEDAIDHNEDGKVDNWEESDWLDDKHSLSVQNAIFWSFASFLQQGGETHPRCWSGRVAAATWWFGTLIITSTYTANLAAFLTVTSSGNQINSLDDLYRSTTIKYGTVSSSMAETMFNEAIRDPFKTMGDRMRKWGLNFATTEASINYTRDQKGQFAFVMDTPFLVYWNGKYDDIRIAKSGFGGFGYGLALPKNSPFVEELSLTILGYRESGKLDIFDESWITKPSSQSSKSISGSGVKVEFQSLLGIVYIMIGGIGVALVVVLLEWVWACAANVDKDNEKKPKRLTEEVCRRLGRLKTDIQRNWMRLQ